MGRFNGAYIWESFDGGLRKECLNENWLPSLINAEQQIDSWRTFYNQVRPYSALGRTKPYYYSRNHAAIGLPHFQVIFNHPLAIRRVARQRLEVFRLEG